MSYSPFPGSNSNASQTPTSEAQPHASLPPRPPPSIGPSPNIRTSLPASAAFQAFRPRQLGSQDWRNQSPTVSAPPAPPSGFTASQTSYQAGSYQSQNYQQQSSTSSYYSQAPQSYPQSSAPQIRNPFPLTGQDYGGGQGAGSKGGSGDGTYDAELEAQIAQWQSAYATKDDQGSKSGFRPPNRHANANTEGSASASGANAGPLGGRGDSSTANGPATDLDSGVAAVVDTADGKQKTVLRSGGGQTWTDASLLEWNPAHFRLFVGNLAGEVTDESLLKAFSKYPSVQKARVIRDKKSAGRKDERAWKSKGYGFVSFSDGDEYFQAARDMQGKYIGSHPVLLRKSTTEIRPVAPNDKKGGKHGKKGGKYQGGQEKTGAGVTKKSNKTKGGLKVLG